jgi:uncharacterized protein YdiU (UPF0061 family)
LALLPLLDDDQDKALASGQASIDAYPELFQNAYRQGMGEKLGLEQVSKDDELLIQNLLKLMQAEKTDFTLTFRRLSDLADPDHAKTRAVSELFNFPEAFGPWLDSWQERLADEKRKAGERQAAMYRANPAFIARNHLVEEAIAAAEKEQDFAPFHELVDRLSNPFEYRQADARLAMPPIPEQVVKQTFCGT